MYSIIYRSLAKPEFGKSDIYQMLSAARTNNEDLGITGCLLYHNNQFLQLLEGDQNQVTKLYQKILNDSRHSHIVTINERILERPLFVDWSMAFHDFGLNGSSADQKSRKIDLIFQKSNVFEKPSLMALEFFKSVNEILYSAN
ncbi:BLUF domain-containing protein [Croceivirga thetidis]|uniref:BLUF domain-containing protein n=1 Tax=Croceivirga thetidis TaxID=2721623 RepID=A0ABX1GQ90_9FLAO|nr:BLUF domain-containing protein [Croceivirga thetidis]NKI32064.1 BLUF domain-containing protein [Croceivirga thetidis]